MSEEQDDLRIVGFRHYVTDERRAACGKATEWSAATKEVLQVSCQACKRTKAFKAQWELLPTSTRLAHQRANECVYQPPDLSNCVTSASLGKSLGVTGAELNMVLVQTMTSAGYGWPYGRAIISDLPYVSAFVRHDDHDDEWERWPVFRYSGRTYVRESAVPDVVSAVRSMRASQQEACRSRLVRLQAKLDKMAQCTNDGAVNSLTQATKRCEQK